MLLVGALVTFTACGNGSTNTAGVAMSPYANTNLGTNGVGTQTGYGQTGYNTYSIPGGTKTLTPVLGGTMSSYGTKTYSISQPVTSGDQIMVSVNGSVMYAVGAILGGFGTTTTQGYLSALNVSVNGQLLGTSLYATYNVPAAGTLTIEGQASLMNIANTSRTNFTTTFNGGVYIARCVSTAGATMLCPAGY